MSKVKLRSHPHCIFNLKAHLVLVTAYRRRVIDAEILQDIEEHVRRVCQMSDVQLLEFSGEPDHVHLLIELHPSIEPAKLINSIKTVSSRMVRKKFGEQLRKQLWKDRFWSRSYCLISVGDGATTDIIKQYIQAQNKPS